MSEKYPEIRIRVKREFLERVDETARLRGLTRASFVKQAVRLHLRTEGTDAD